MSGPASSDKPIVVVDDDEAMRRACDATLRRAGYKVATYADGPSGLRAVEEDPPWVLVTDLKMPGMGGIEVIQRVKEIDADIVVVVITGFATVDSAVEAMKAGAYDFIPKPFTASQLRTIIGRAVERHELVMEAKRLRAEKEAQARKFITFVSHQLQSPLGAVRQYLDVLLHQLGADAPQKHRQWIERSRAKINEMLEIISDWLTLSKVEGGQLVTERKPLGWPKIVAKTLEDFAATAEAKGIALHNAVPDDLPGVVGDESALRMLLSNYVSNAIKYSPEGSEVSVAGSVGDRGVTVSVTDNGIGIAPDQQPHVFQEFYRVRDGSTKGISGTGMGLAICKKIAEELGGQVGLESEPGKGSTFSVTLPNTEPDEDRPA